MENLPKKPRGKRGQGCVFRPKGSRNWWIKFSYNGQVTYKNSETESKKDATRFLQDEILRRRQGVSGDSDRTTVSYLADSMIQTWQLEQHSERSRKAEGSQLRESPEDDIVPHQ